MKYFSKILFFALLVSATSFFFNTIHCLANTAFQDAQAEEQETEYTEEEYAAWESADKEPDPIKRGTMLIGFIEKYPNSKLMPYINSSYERLLFECSDGKKYQELETLAERWLKIHPNKLETLAYLAKASEILDHTEKCVQSYEAIYQVQPGGSIAYQIAQLYKKLKNDAKYREWVEIVFKYPEYDTDFRLRYSLMQFYAEKNDIAQATEFARATIKAADLVKQPGEETLGHLRVARHDAYHVIGVNLYDQQKFDDAIAAFQKALKAEKYADGYYWIGMCEWAQGKVEEAIITFAKAELMGGDIAPKAKEKVEQLYKALHNDTTIGIDKVYRKAKEQPDNF